MRVGVLTAFAAQMAKKDLVLEIGDSGEQPILVLAEAKEVAANEVAAHLKVHSILASSLRELKVLKYFLLEAPLKSPTEHSLVGIEEGYSEKLASEARIELPGS